MHVRARRREVKCKGDQEHSVGQHFKLVIRFFPNSRTFAAVHDLETYSFSASHLRMRVVSLVQSADRRRLPKAS